MLKADASGAGTFCVVHVNWITKRLESSVSVPASHKRFHIHRFRLLVPCEMGQASSIEARLMERKRCLKSTKQGEGEGRGGKAESVDPIPVFSLLKWSRLTDSASCILTPPHPTPVRLPSPSPHRPSWQCARGSHQLHDHPLHLECPQPPVHQWHQPGLQGTWGPSPPPRGSLGILRGKPQAEEVAGGKVRDPCASGVIGSGQAGGT